jgi:ribosomal protein S18 acetylase RimI-like enzyme
MGAPQRIAIEVAQAAGVELLDAVARLLPQLSRSSPPPTLEQLDRIIADPAITLLVAKSGERPAHGGGDADGQVGDQVVGMLTLAIFQLPTGVRAWIEDVVVDDAARGTGVASALVQTAAELAENRGARTVDLTSRPDRVAANRLYVRLGFTRRETNVYRLTLEAPASHAGRPGAGHAV